MGGAACWRLMFGTEQFLKDKRIYTPMLNQPLTDRIWFYPADEASNTAMFTAKDSNFSVKIPTRAYLGCIGAAPSLERTRSCGGNMDADEATADNTVYFPVSEPAPADGRCDAKRLNRTDRVDA